MALTGFFTTTNYAAQLRSVNSVAGDQGRTPMALPRHKYTFLIEILINPAALSAFATLTAVAQYVINGRIYGQLKSIDYPKPRFEIETLRTYNRYRKIYRKLQWEPASLVWHDDSTSMVQSLIKEYINFYSNTGSIGSNDIVQSNNEFNTESGIVGQNVRNGMNIRPSLGLKLRSQPMRHFFESITIYDFGTEPTSVNVHTFHKPVIAAFANDNLDWYSTDLISSHWTFEYEGYFFNVGQDVSNFEDIINKTLLLNNTT